jgi:hypothetical protein
MNILIVEDAQIRKEWFEENLRNHKLWITDDSAKAIEWLGKETFSVVFLDHDLQAKHYKDEPFIVGEDAETRYLRIHNHTGTGRDVSRFLRDHPEIAVPTIIVHSWNTTGGEMMLRDLQDRFVRWMRFGSDSLKRLIWHLSPNV